MSNYVIAHLQQNRTLNSPRPMKPQAKAALLVLPFALFLFATGCQTQKDSGSSKFDQAAISKAAEFASLPAVTNSDSLILHEGDTLNITFPGAAELNTL